VRPAREPFELRLENPVQQSTKPCPFCNLSQQRIVVEGVSAVALWDTHPLNPGHVLIVPRRHVASWFEASMAEREEMMRLADDARRIVIERHSPDGFNLGVNDGATAGQSVPHVHVHLIPRYRGDVPDPRGGVRWIIPERARYWSKR
jgi:diadenosine tetraphosphate (Ap4A) HIT family hydrolase